MVAQDSLSYRISKRKKLTKAEIEALIRLLSPYCNAKTKSMLRLVLGCVPDIDNCGIYGRVLLVPRVEYCAGQSYPDEIRTVRKLLLGR